MNAPRFLMVLKTEGTEIYDTTYVERLAARIRERVAGDPEIVVLTDTPEPMRGVDFVIPLLCGLPGWWSKMELFIPGPFDDGRLNVYLDLDTLVVGSLDPLLAYEGELAVLADFYKPESRIGSAVLLWRGKVMGPAWEEFVALGPQEVMPAHPFRMDYFLAQWLLHGDRVQDLWPGLAVSYKRHCRKQGGPPEGAGIICFHGNPRPRDLTDGDWARTLWLGGEG